ncbi:hypothetical protein J6590_034624 [Homalodisca vitripennis]|nr:hypothetical protein J6590_034624 [Homalodisca vitripennis]
MVQGIGDYQLTTYRMFCFRAKISERFYCAEPIVNALLCDGREVTGPRPNFCHGDSWEPGTAGVKRREQQRVKCTTLWLPVLTRRREPDCP